LGKRIGGDPIAEGLPPPQDTLPPKHSDILYCSESQSRSLHFDLDSLDFDSYSHFTWADSDSDSDDDIRYATLHVGVDPMSMQTPLQHGSYKERYNHFTTPYVDLRRKMEQVWTKQQWEVWVRTMYKRKGKKVHPVNNPLPDGIKPGGSANMKAKDNETGQRRGVTVERGSRLTPE